MVMFVIKPVLVAPGKGRIVSTRRVFWSASCAKRPLPIVGMPLRTTHITHPKPTPYILPKATDQSRAGMLPCPALWPACLGRGIAHVRKESASHPRAGRLTWRDLINGFEGRNVLRLLQHQANLSVRPMPRHDKKRQSTYADPCFFCWTGREKVGILLELVCLGWLAPQKKTCIHCCLKSLVVKVFELRMMLPRSVGGKGLHTIPRAWLRH